jgi:hypothetical protein
MEMTAIAPEAKQGRARPPFSPHERNVETGSPLSLPLDEMYNHKHGQVREYSPWPATFFPSRRSSGEARPKGASARFVCWSGRPRRCVPRCASVVGGRRCGGPTSIVGLINRRHGPLQARRGAVQRGAGFKSFAASAPANVPTQPHTEPRNCNRGSNDGMAADKVERRALAGLVPYAKNAGTHSPEQVEQLAASMREFGFTNPVLLDEQGGIRRVHFQRQRAATLSWRCKN